jgi:hypothetical protein
MDNTFYDLCPDALHFLLYPHLVHQLIVRCFLFKAKIFRKNKPAHIERHEEILYYQQ